MLFSSVLLLVLSFFHVHAHPLEEGFLQATSPGCAVVPVVEPEACAVPPPTPFWTAKKCIGAACIVAVGATVITLASVYGSRRAHDNGGSSNVIASTSSPSTESVTPYAAPPSLTPPSYYPPATTQKQTITPRTPLPYTPAYVPATTPYTPIKTPYTPVRTIYASQKTSGSTSDYVVPATSY